MEDVLLAAARPWHFWLGASLVIGAVLATVATAIGYLVRVSSAKYPRD